MPFIRITVIGPTLTLDQIHRLQEGTTDLMTGTMRKPIEGTSVLVEQIHQGGWSIARAQVPIAAQVEVTIGLDTNTPDEKARFMTEMMALLRTVLGREVREETYITIREFRHDSYGRGGLTRAERDQRRTAA
jgi:phenylpyruvate tautomerase PptA (4-oxalocrotonate tautomerase family)